MEVKGIAQGIVDELVARTSELSQGRNAGCIGFVNGDGYIDSVTSIVDGGLTGLPLRLMLQKTASIDGNSVLEGIEALPENSVLINTRPGKTGLNVDIGGIDYFELPIVNIGVKDGSAAGVSIVYPKPEYFDLAAASEEIELASLAARDMDAEKEIIRRNINLNLKYLDVSQPLAVVGELKVNGQEKVGKPQWETPRLKVKGIRKDLAEKLVQQSMAVGQGREVGVICLIEQGGTVVPYGELVTGGIGYVPSRLLASSAVDLKGKSLRSIYRHDVPENAIIVHTHPGGTGVMHIGDANAGPGMWGRPIIAIGHDNKGEIQGATVIEVTEELYRLAEEDEKLSSTFFDAKTPEEEADIRNRKLGIAQEYTNLCKPIAIH